MKIGILIKQVPDTETKIQVKADKSGIDETAEIKYVINPYDEFAIEEALKLAESLDEAKTVVISAGPERSIEIIKKAIAMGVDDAIHIVSNALESGDSYSIAKTIIPALKEEKFDIIFAGKQAMDYDNSQVPILIAEKLGIPCITNVSEFEFQKDEKKVIVTKEVEGGTKKRWELPLPCIIGATKGLNEPRYENLKGIAKASQKVKNKEIKRLAIKDEIIPEQMIKTEIIKFSSPPKKEAGQIHEIIEGQEAEIAQKLVKFLKDKGCIKE